MKKPITLILASLLALTAWFTTGCERPQDTPPPADTPPTDQPATPPPAQ